MNKPIQFLKYHVGQRVLYTGVTSYTQITKGVRRAPGTIIAVGESISIILDDYRRPYYVPDYHTDPPNPMRGVYIIPQKQYANISVGDLVTGEKRIDII